MRLMRKNSITLRLTLLFSAASTVVLLLLGYLIGSAVEQHFVEQDMEVLGGKLQLTRRALEKVRTEQELIGIPQQLDDSLVSHSGLAVAVQAPGGQILFATSGAEFPEKLLQQPATGLLRPLEWTTAGQVPFRGLSAQVLTGLPGAPLAVVAVAVDISHHAHFMRSFRVTLWGFVILAAVLSGFLGWIAVRRGLAPLQAIRRQAEAITAHRLDERLALEAVPEELAELAETLNAMLSRLEESFTRLSDFSSDLAHEFRTPVSNLLTQTQVTLGRARSPDEYRDVLASNVEEFERMSRMIGDMLFIAKADDGQIIPEPQRMALEQVAEELLEFYQLLAEEQGIELSATGKASINGDPLMIRRAMSNLLSNAIRHTPPGGHVSVAISTRASECVEIAVINSGVTIPDEHLSRLFDRFYRADPARHGDGAHSGLGLAIVKSIIEAHGGTVKVISAAGLTSFVLSIPLAGQEHA